MYGMGMNTVEWFVDYLSGRTQRTKVNDVLSGSRINSCGVPQGSILGPLMFILYINDMQNVITDCSISLYADDTALFYASRSYVDMMLAIRDDIGSVTEWLNLNKLTLNTRKTKFMIFGTKSRLKHCGDMPVIINGDVIERVTEFKYLGVILDEMLTFDAHIAYIHNKASKKMGAIRKVRQCVDENTALRLYKSLILPHFDYCDTVYMTATKESLQKLQLLQNHACRVMLLCDREAHILDMHTNLGLLLLDERRNLHFGFQLHKTVHGKDKGCLSQYMIPVAQTGRAVTRGKSSNNMVIPAVRTGMGQKGIGYRGPSFWNKLPHDLKVVDVFRSFKRMISSMVHQLFGDHPT